MATAAGQQAHHLGGDEYDIEQYTKEKLSPSGLTAKQEGQWNDTMSLMAWSCPGFRHLFYKLLTNHDGKHAAVFTDGVPIAATDARNILLNPERFFSEYDLRERTFILGHEIMHNVYQDVPFLKRCRESGTVPMDDGTTLPFDEKSMQHAMDYRINALLKESNIGKPPKNVLLDEEIAKANDGICETYKKVYEKYEQEGTLGGDGFDIVLMPGSSTGQNQQAAMPNQQQWMVEVKAAHTIEQMKSQGKMSMAMQRMFEEVLNPQVPWTDHLKGIFNRKVGNGSYNWRRPDRRHIIRDLYMPSRSGNGAGHVVVWADTSGSISQKEMTHYLAELTAIVEDCCPKRLTVLWCDAAINRIDEVAEASDMAALSAEAYGPNGLEGVGGGGTDVGPVFDWMAEQDERPEVFIGFTDGYVSFPHTPPHETLMIWASVASPPEHYPYGDVVEINTKG